MSTQSKSSRILFKKMVYIIQIGTSYVWSTASSVRSDCIHKAYKHFKVQNESELNERGAEVILISTKEVK